MSRLDRAIFLLRVALYAVPAVALCVILLLPLLARAQVPAAADKWKRELTRNARLSWGMDAPIATLAAQVETESRFDPNARSPVGARGLAQFMPSTSAWISGAYPALADNDPLNPVWALRALATYDRFLWDRQPLTASDCDRGAFFESAYNGGEAALGREQDACLAVATCDPDRWWGNVETIHGQRAEWAWRQNRDYPRRIKAREPNYVKAGWGTGLCAGGT